MKVNKDSGKTKEQIDKERRERSKMSVEKHRRKQRERLEMAENNLVLSKMDYKIMRKQYDNLQDQLLLYKSLISDLTRNPDVAYTQSQAVLDRIRELESYFASLQASRPTYITSESNPTTSQNTI